MATPTGEVVFAQANDVLVFSGTSANDVYRNILGLIVQGADLKPSTNYAILVEANIAIDDANTNQTAHSWRIREGSATLASTDLRIPIGGEPTQTNMSLTYNHMIKIQTGAVPEDYRVQFQTHDCVTGDRGQAYNCMLLFLDLDAFGTENTDWYYNELVSDVADDGTTDRASLTFTPTNEAFIVFSSAIIGGQTSSFSDGGFQILLDAVGVYTTDGDQIHDDKGDLAVRDGGLLVWSEVLANASQVWSVRDRNTTTGRHFYSNILILKAALFGTADVFTTQSGPTQNPVDTFEQIDSVSYTADAGATKQLLIGFCRHDITGGGNRTVSDFETGGTSYREEAPLAIPQTTFPAYVADNASAPAGGVTGSTILALIDDVNGPVTIDFNSRSTQSFASMDGACSLILDVLVASQVDPPVEYSPNIVADLGEEVIKEMALDAGVTTTDGSVVGKLNQIAGNAKGSYVGYRAAKTAAEAAANWI